MQVIINEKEKLVEYWLTSAEKSDLALREALKPEFTRWKAKKYLPVVYESGTGNLRDGMDGLMRKYIQDKAKHEMEAEKKERNYSI